jgi:sigma-B regulation protein RsbU (phosphoserine phosphatase)
VSSEHPVPEVRLLLVEDNDGDALLFESLIASSQAGTWLRPTAHVHRVARLADAFAPLADRRCDIVLLDLGLPDSMGLHAVRALRAAAPTIPIVVLTGLDDETAALQALRAGAQDYLVKDTVTGDLVLRAVRYAIERKNTEDEVARARWLAGIGETALAIRHEVNNPLASLLLNVELLREGSYDGPKAFDGIVEDVTRIADVIRRLAQLDDPSAVEYMTGRPMLDLLRQVR